MAHLASNVDAGPPFYQKANDLGVTPRARVMKSSPSVFVLMMDVNMVILHKILNHREVAIVCSFQQGGLKEYALVTPSMLTAYCINNFYLSRYLPRLLYL